MGNNNEFNKLPDSDKNSIKNENNVLDIVNLYEKTFISGRSKTELNLSNNINNDLNAKEVEIKKEKKTNHSFLKFATNFVAALALTATVQTSIEIPVFSRIFNPSQIVSTIDSPVGCKVADLTATYKNISFIVSFDSVKDFSSNEYSLMLVKTGCDNDEYISNILKSLKNKHKIIVDTNETYIKFSQCITQNKIENLTEDTDYVVLVLKDEKIIEKKSIKTNKLQAVKNVDVDTKIDGDGRHFLIKTYIYSDFDDYDNLYLQLINLETGAIVKAYATVAKHEIDDSVADPKGHHYPTSNIVMKDPETNIPEPTSSLGYQLRVFCSTDNPELFGDKESFTKDDVKYYLIYTHDSAINI